MSLRDKKRRGLRRSVIRARENPIDFARFVLRKEDGGPVTIGAVHEEWINHFLDNKKALIFAPVGHGKSALLSTMLILWLIGTDPNIRIAIISSDKGGMPQKLLGAIRRYIEEDKRVRLVFPNLRPGGLWDKQAIMVERTLIAPDPTVQTFGRDGTIHGSRLDVVLFDDYDDRASAMSPEIQEKSWHWITASVLTRAPPSGMRVWAVGNTWAENDTLHRFEALGFATKRYSAFVPNPDPEATEKELPLIPAVWSLDRLREQERTLGPVAASLMLRNELVSDEFRRIKRAWIEQCQRRGVGMTLASRWNPNAAPVITGVDLGIGKNPKKGDLTVLFTAAFLPDGSRLVLDIRSGRWRGKDTISHLSEVYELFGGQFFIENVSGQDFLVQWAEDISSLPLRRFTTTASNKWALDYGVESIGVEMSRSQWIIPVYAAQPHPETGEPVPSHEIAMWRSDMLTFTPHGHTGDHLMASWVCREGAREAGFVTGGGDTQMPPSDTQDWLAGFGGFGLLS